jgi:hypothetical protein
VLFCGNKQAEVYANNFNYRNYEGQMNPKRCLVVLTIMGLFSSSPSVAEDNLFSASLSRVNRGQPDFTIKEIKREQRISTLRIPGFNNRSSSESRWTMCAFTDLAIKRGYKYWAALYPKDSSDIIQLGFLNSKDEEIKTVLGSQFAGDGVIVSAVGDFAAFCGIKNASSADREQKDKERFHSLSAKAAQGNAGAQFDLGFMYADGQGTPQDYAEAYKWYNLAASLGQAGASAYRDKLALSMTPEQITEGHRRSSMFLLRKDSPAQIQSQTPTSKPEKPTLQPAEKADDPFTGTWRETILMTITPNGEGISIQQNGNKTDIAHDGKDFVVEGGMGMTRNYVRVDDRTLKTTSLMDGKVISKRTETVSPDGRHYTRIQEEILPPELSQRGISGNSTFEYDRIGSIASGDAFLGTWRQTSPRGLRTYTITVDGEIFDIAQNGRPWLAGKLDGNELKTGAGGSTAKAKRIDAQTIEILYKFTDGTNALESKHLYQVMDNILIETLIQTKTGAAPGPELLKRVNNFERIK